PISTATRAPGDKLGGAGCLSIFSGRTTTCPLSGARPGWPFPPVPDVPETPGNRQRRLQQLFQDARLAPGTVLTAAPGAAPSVAPAMGCGPQGWAARCPVASIGTVYSDVRAVTYSVRRSGPPKVTFAGCSGNAMTPSSRPDGSKTCRPSADVMYRLPFVSTAAPSAPPPFLPCGCFRVQNTLPLPILPAAWTGYATISAWPVGTPATR